MPRAAVPFADSYEDARRRFLQALDAFEGVSGRPLRRERYVIDEARDLSIDVAELRPSRPQKLYVVVSGIHGIEGYAGNAIQRALLLKLAPRLRRETAGLLLVHALNPFGMQQRRRVNANNVDLNRNFAVAGQDLYASDSSGYLLVAKLLGPARAYDARRLTRIRHVLGLAGAVGRHGFATLRQATLAGQYAAPQGIFYGGSEAQPETTFFERVFAECCAAYEEILVTDLHTGYGERGRAYPLFARFDSDAMRTFATEGVRDARGKNQSYDARGDLVGYCYATAKRINPNAICNAVVLELGTHALGALAQLQDLECVVRENQVHLHGAESEAIAKSVRERFVELFNPSAQAWQESAVSAALSRIEDLLVRLEFFGV